MLTPLNLQKLTRGPWYLVKMHGAKLRQRGRTLKQKYLTVPVKTQKTPKMSDGLGKYQNGENQT